MSKISKILHIALYSVFALAGLLIMINDLTVIGDAIKTVDLTAMPLVSIIVDVVIAVLFIVMALIGIVKAVKNKFSKLPKQNYVLFALYGLFILMSGVLALILVADMNNAMGGYGGSIPVPGEVIFALIIGSLILVASLIISKIKVHGQPLPFIASYPVVGLLGLIGSIALLSNGGEGLPVLVYIILLIGSLLFAAIPVIAKFVLKEELIYQEGVVTVPVAPMHSPVAEQLSGAPAQTYAGQTQKVAGRPVYAAGAYFCAPAEDIRQAKALLDDGLITEEEYTKIKARVIDRF